MSHPASTAYDQDDDPAEEHPSLATLGLRGLTLVLGLFILLPLVLFSPVALMVWAILSRDKDQLVIESPGREPESVRHYRRVVPAPVEELGVELIAG